MLTTTVSEIARERNLGTRALELFVSVYGLEWSDSYRAAKCERTFGREYVAQVLAIVSATGRTFMDCALAVEAGDTAIPALRLFTAPLNGREPAMVEVDVEPEGYTLTIGGEYAGTYTTMDVLCQAADERGVEVAS